jgi:amino acid transporter
VYLSWIAVGVCSALLVGIINWVGVKTSARVQQAATGGLLLIGVAFFFASNLSGRMENLHPHFTSPSGVLRVIILMPFLMVGFDIIPQTAEEIKIPFREVGKIILLSIFMATAWYVLVQWGVGLSLPPEMHKSSDLPTADAAAQAFRLAPAATVMVIGGLLGILTTWNAFLVGATRLLFGMGRAQMLPQVFARLHPRYQTPVFGILFVTLCSLLAPFLGRKALVWLANASSLGVVVAYFLVSASFVQLRRKHPELPRPYRVRHGRLVGYAATVITLLFILLYLPFSPASLVWPQEWGIVLVWVLLGILAYALGKQLHPAMDRAAQEGILLGQYATAPVNPESESGPAGREQP